ncbi:MAG: hypothetical protein JJ693_01505 [Acidithiobacillus sp.]|nr:hypothetical protein [Acidithiobacillus sp.]
MPIVAPQYGITPERKRARELDQSPASRPVPVKPTAGESPHPQETPRPQFWYPKDLALPEESQPSLQPATRLRTVTVEVRKRRSIIR